jgi:hypothetical protein
MATVVRCDVCGKLFNSSYLGSHKRLAHAKRSKSAPSEPEAIHKILELFRGLSPEGKKTALEQLAAPEED